jgi:hypothetical protein
MVDERTEGRRPLGGGEYSTRALGKEGVTEAKCSGAFVGSAELRVE